jgi:hypothetical protein
MFFGKISDIYKHAHTHTHTHTHTHIYICIYMYIHVYVCICMYVCVGVDVGVFINVRNLSQKYKDCYRLDPTKENSNIQRLFISQLGSD